MGHEGVDMQAIRESLHVRALHFAQQAVRGNGRVALPLHDARHGILVDPGFQGEKIDDIQHVRH